MNIMSINNTRKIISSSDIDAKILELKGELDILIGFRLRYRGRGITDWDSSVLFVRDGVLFVQDNLLVEYVKANSGLNLNSWPIKYIDWEKVADEFREVHKNINFKGIQYWIIEE